MSKRIQIPVGEQDCSQFQAAARRAGLPLAEWARRQLREKADEVLGREALSPYEALARLKELEAPIAPIEKMLDESQVSWVKRLQA
ncbi:MAG TPA: hypothetical protein VE075_03500 [Thermoanaerobaculia bacterium]|nr:hypothetical protein [Thermoanaerobaculia bacterium]